MNQSKLHWSQNYTKSHNLSLRKVFLTSQKWRKDRKITNLMRFLKMKNMNLQILKAPNTEKNKFLQKWMIYDGQKQLPVAYEKAVLQNFANFTGKLICWSLFLIKSQAFSPAALLKKTPIQVISCKICKSFKKNYFEEHLRTTASGGGSSGDFQEK